MNVITKVTLSIGSALLGAAFVVLLASIWVAEPDIQARTGSTGLLFGLVGLGLAGIGFLLWADE